VQRILCNAVALLEDNLSSIMKVISLLEYPEFLTMHTMAYQRIYYSLLKVVVLVKSY
jgi:hypothetical protein